mmetsp:Transcript_5286/g.12606  ORF Transcript_5286/g.12606 Transcript_5286/m.12606 type:complete len:339 (-) Transcript_5286:659-1675(-)
MGGPDLPPIPPRRSSSALAFAFVQVCPSGCGSSPHRKQKDVAQGPQDPAGISRSTQSNKSRRQRTATRSQSGPGHQRSASIPRPPTNECSCRRRNAGRRSGHNSLTSSSVMHSVQPTEGQVVLRIVSTLPPPPPSSPVDCSMEVMRPLQQSRQYLCWQGKGRISASVSSSLKQISHVSSPSLFSLSPAAMAALLPSAPAPAPSSPPSISSSEVSSLLLSTSLASDDSSPPDDADFFLASSSSSAAALAAAAAAAARASSKALRRSWLACFLSGEAGLLDDDEPCSLLFDEKMRDSRLDGRALLLLVSGTGLLRAALELSSSDEAINMSMESSASSMCS